jgi:hypothetical protein
MKLQKLKPNFPQLVVSEMYTPLMGIQIY